MCRESKVAHNEEEEVGRCDQTGRGRRVCVMGWPNTATLPTNFTQWVQVG
jgi:hypothetical protein